MVVIVLIPLDYKYAKGGTIVPMSCGVQVGKYIEAKKMCSREFIDLMGYDICIKSMHMRYEQNEICTK